MAVDRAGCRAPARRPEHSELSGTVAPGPPPGTAAGFRPAPGRRPFVADVAPVILPVTVTEVEVVIEPSAGDVMVMVGLIGLTPTVLEVEVPVLPAPSVALT